MTDNQKKLIEEYYEKWNRNAYYRPDFRKDEKLQSIIEAARLMWYKKTEEYYAKHGETGSGSCVSGAGIGIAGLDKRDRYVRHNVMIIPSHPFIQGNLNWEHSVDKIIQFLKDNGIDARYIHGRMD